MFEFDTLSIIGEGDNDYESSISFPIFQSSTFGGGKEYSYSRCSNPTRNALENAVADAYKLVSKIKFENAYYRKDIGIKYREIVKE